MYTLLTIVFTTLLLTFVTSYIILHAAVQERAFRRLLLFFVVMTPFVFVYAALRALFCKPKPVRYNIELGQIEDEIESERAKIFGGKIMQPSFSQRWQASYLYAVEKSAAAAAKLNPDLAAYGFARLR
jgi:hypothetical protein